MVVIFLPTAADAAVRHARVATPSRCTVQAPHCPRPQPNFVPVKPSVSRSTQSNGISGLTSTSRRVPLTSREIMEAPDGPSTRMDPTGAHYRSESFQILQQIFTLIGG